MITFKQHIELMDSVKSSGMDTYMADMSPMQKLEYLRDFNATYPIHDNMCNPRFSKNIYTNINELVLGQFIMLEQIITGKTKLPDHLVDLEIAKLIIRPKQHKDFDNSDALLELDNQKDILGYDVREVYWVLDAFIKNRNKTLFEDFAGVFYEPNDEDDEDSDATEEHKTSEMLFSQQWYWYSVVRMLAGEDIHKYEATYMLPMSVVLPEMSYIAQKNKIDSARSRQAEAMRKL